LFGGDVLLDLTGEGSELHNGVGAGDSENDVCALRFELAVDFSFETAQARADADVENVIGKRKGVDEAPALQAQFAGGGFEIRTLADECDAIQAPKALADRHPSLAQAAGTIHIDAQRVGVNGRLGDRCREHDEQQEWFHTYFGSTIVCSGGVGSLGTASPTRRSA
jgi:hypothetical protein